MARLEISEYDGHDKVPSMAKVTLSRRNVLALLHKLDMAGSARRLENTCVYVEGDHTEELRLVLCVEDDDEHYADERRLGSAPGRMVPATESFIRDRESKNTE